MARLLNPNVNVDAENKIVSKGWKPAAVKKAQFVAVKPGSANTGEPRLAIQYTITGGRYEGDLLFGGGIFKGRAIHFTRKQLEAARPDITWAEYEFPDKEELKDASLLRDYNEQINDDLVGAELFVLVSHREFNGEMQPNVAGVAPATAGIDTDDEDE